MELVLKTQKFLFDYFDSLSGINYLRAFLDMIDIYLKIENSTNYQFENAQCVHENLEIFDKEGVNNQQFYSEMALAFPKTICIVLEYIRSLK
jgi:hypothetical protein